MNGEIKKRKFTPDSPTADIDTRRIAPGVRTSSDFFSPDHQRREMTRAEYLNVRASEEYARRESRWYKRIYRWFTNVPQVVDFNARLANSHAKTIEDVKAVLLKQADEMQTELAKRKMADLAQRAGDSRD